MKKYNYLFYVFLIIFAVFLVKEKPIITYAAEPQNIDIQAGESKEEEIMLTANYALTYGFTDSTVASVSQVGSSIVYTNGSVYYGKKISIHGDKIGTTTLTIYAGGVAIKTYNITVNPIQKVFDVHEGDIATITYTSVYDEIFDTNSSDVSFSTTKKMNSSTISINGNSITTITYTYSFLIGFNKEMDDSFIISGSTSGDIINVSAKVSGHEWANDYTIEKEDTCTEDGYKDIRCIICNKVKEDSGVVIAHKGHEWNKDYTIDKKPDCVNVGYKTIHCKRCDFMKENSKTEIPALGHEWNKDYTIDKKPDCVNVGYKTIHCKRCDSMKENSKTEISALGHEWDEGVVIKKSELDSNGIKECTCNRCKLHSQFSLPKLQPQIGIEIYDSDFDITYEISSIGNNKNSVSVSEGGDDSYVVIPNSIRVNGITYKVTSIDEEAFVDNNKIKKLVIGDNVVKIDSNAFSNCRNLKKLVIGKKVKKINDDAFRDCKKLNSITIKSKSLSKLGTDVFKGIYKKAKFKVPKKQLKKYKKMIKKAGAPKKSKITK